MRLPRQAARIVLAPILAAFHERCPVSCSTSSPMTASSISCRLTYVYEDMVGATLASGALECVLGDWCPRLSRC